MYILVPVQSADGYDAKIAKLTEVKKWAVIAFDNGKAQSVDFCDDWRDSGVDWLDFVILENRFESYMDFMNEGMMCLCRRNEETLEELMSAFSFKELDEIGI